MRRGRLGKAAVGLHLDGVDQVGELDGVLDEEHRDVVADQVPVALFGVELHGEAPHVARRVDRSGPAGHGREPHEHRGLLADLGEHFGGGVLRERLGELEEAVHAGGARVHDTFGNALVVEVRDLVAQDEVFEQGGSPRVGAQRVLIVRQRDTLVCGQHGAVGARALMQLSARARTLVGLVVLAHRTLLGPWRLLALARRSPPTLGAAPTRALDGPNRWPRGGRRPAVRAKTCGKPEPASPASGATASPVSGATASATSGATASPLSCSR